MTWIYNRPSEFAKDMIEGFASAHASLVRRVPGGVVRNTLSQSNTVAIVVGGGSGHYPAFAGLVGQGLAHGAVMGNLFASPSAQQICSVARAANNGAGVLLLYGNYAGDVLHFGLACERLRSEGIPCEALAITDDITSASSQERNKRRGVAGDLVIFKIAAAAAEKGHSLAEVFAIAQHSNERTRTLGLAFSGCTLPGAEHPLFTVPEGIMGFGMGIHGEPGISEMLVPRAEPLAKMLIDSLMGEVPDDVETAKGARIAVIINGLGSVKYEELFVLWRFVRPLLIETGAEIADVQIGEFVTSFDMAGMSLTVAWLDNELESLWLAPACSPAFTRGSAIQHIPLTTELLQQNTATVLARGSAASQKTAQLIMDILSAAAETITHNVDELGRIDAIAGDGDHGIGMERGIHAARNAAEKAVKEGAGAGALLQFAADAWADDAGGTSGAIWGVILNTIGTVLGNQYEPDAGTVSRAVKQASDGVMHFGKAKPGDKTLVDVLHPFSNALSEAVTSGASLSDSWKKAAEVARKCVSETADMVPRIGRARPLAERSVGTPDAGAVSMSMVIDVVSRFFMKEQQKQTNSQETHL
ncbi:TPA: dihydroxyacetone kinase family protein [Klebsiella pneumoniae]